MFLLIRKCWDSRKKSTWTFKFHYVSINSQTFLKRGINSRKTLNSIMFLLILLLLLKFLLSLLPLNSIMFLLIHMFAKIPLSRWSSLNSIMFLLIHVFANSRKVILIAFKFHYVSINSILQRTARNYLNLALNSIMFLLILVAVP